MKKTVNTIMDYQTKILALRVWLSKYKQVAYTQDEIYIMEEVLGKESKLYELQDEMIEFLTTVDNDEVEKILRDKELMQSEYLFTYEDQRKSIKEIINKDFTVEDLLDWGEK